LAWPGHFSDDEAVPAAEDGAALAGAATVSTAPAKPREPAITAEAASFLTVLMVVISIDLSVFLSGVSPGLSKNLWRHEDPDIGQKMRLVAAVMG
jgi:hypothetical protein